MGCSTHVLKLARVNLDASSGGTKLVNLTHLPTIGVLYCFSSATTAIPSKMLSFLSISL